MACFLFCFSLIFFHYGKIYAGNYILLGPLFLSDTFFVQGL